MESPHGQPDAVVHTIADPATPYQNAVFMARTLANARLLTLAGYGHADGDDPSTCVNDNLVSYFVDGALPPEGAVCQQDQAPFKGDDHAMPQTGGEGRR